jgi:TPP-dependent pyruvate/acetoin dehydrogenase alpha subunit
MRPDADVKQRIYRHMVRALAAERGILRLVDEGKAHILYHSGRGQEGVGPAAIAALRSDDYLFYDHRGVGQLLAKGLDPVELFGDVLATVAGATGGLGAGIFHSADPRVGILGQSGTVGGSFVLAAGAGLSARYNGTDRVVLCIFGDGTANRGTFHEAANAAGIWKLPVIWLCENNGYSMSVPLRESSAVADLASRAAGYGMPGHVVDGQDPMAVYEAVREAVRRARDGEGPSFVEAKTYRLRGHFEGDPQPYRTQDEVTGWRERDPIDVLGANLLAEGSATEASLRMVAEDAEREMADAAARAEAAPLPDRSRIFEGIYA